MDPRFIVVPLLIILGIWYQMYLNKDIKKKIEAIEKSGPKPGHVYIIKHRYKDYRTPTIFYNENFLMDVENIKEFAEAELTEPGVLTISGGFHKVRITTDDLKGYVIVKVMFTKTGNALVRIVNKK